MQTSENGINLIKKYEGCKLKAYYCPSGKLTIGYGHAGADVYIGQTITKDKAEEFFNNDLKRFEKGVNNLLKVKINQNQFDALVSFSYNCGLGKLKTSTLLKLVNEKKFQEASQQFSRWILSNGKPSNGLKNR